MTVPFLDFIERNGYRYLFRQITADFILKHIPPELIHQISLSLPRTDLFSMTIVNRCFRAEAECLLYESVAMIACFDTLLAVKSEAILLKSLMILSCYPLGHRFVRRLCNCMLVLSSLTHLQLLLPFEQDSVISLIGATFK